MPQENSLMCPLIQSQWRFFEKGFKRRAPYRSLGSFLETEEWVTVFNVNPSEGYHKETDFIRQHLEPEKSIIPKPGILGPHAQSR